MKPSPNLNPFVKEFKNKQDISLLLYIVIMLENSKINHLKIYAHKMATLKNFLHQYLLNKMEWLKEKAYHYKIHQGPCFLTEVFLVISG